MWDIQKARSGRGYWKGVAHTASGTSMRFNMGSPGAAVASTVGTTTVARFFLRVIDLPSADLEWWSINFTTFNNHGIIIRTDGKIVTFMSTFGVENRGTPSTMALAEVTGNNFDRWYKFEITVTSVVQVGNDDYTISCTITDPDGVSEVISQSVSKNGGTTAAVPLFTSSSFQAGSQNGTIELDLDDYLFIQASDGDQGSAVLPAEDRVASFFPTSQGASAQWAGDWSLAGNAVVGSAAQTAASAALVTTFGHETVTQRGLGITSIGGIRLSAVVTTPISTITKFRYGGASVDGSAQSTSAFPSTQALNINYCDISAISLATFDTMEWGFESNHASSNNLWTFVAHVLYSGNAHSLRERSTGGYRHAVVEWTGDAVGSTRAITVGWCPHLVILLPLTAASGESLSMAYGDLPQNLVTDAFGFQKATVFQSMNTTGFTVKSPANGSGHRWVAFCYRDDGDGLGGRILVHGSSPKPGAETPIATVFGYGGANIAVNLLVAARLGSSGAVHFKTTTMPAGSSVQLNAASVFLTDAITAFNANGFSLGAQANLTSATMGLMWFGFSLTNEIQTGIAIGTIAPSDPNVQVTLADGFDPYMVWAKGDNSQTATKRLDEAEYSGTDDNNWSAAGAFATGTGIRELTPAARTFTIAGGSASGKHLDASPAVTCHWAAWSRAAEVGPPAEVDSFPDSSVGLIWVEAFLPD